MGRWEQPEVPEEELTAEQRAEAVQRIQERREKEYEKGRKIFVGMLIFWLISEILSVILQIFVFSRAIDLAFYMLTSILGIALIIVLAYYLYHGKTGARIAFGILLGLNIVRQFAGMMSAMEKIVLVQGIIGIAVSVLYFYIVFVCPPVREFLYGQSTE